MPDAFKVNTHLLDQVLREGERIHAVVPTVSNEVVVTEDRIAVANTERIALDLAIGELRRIQFDIERDRPATLVIVPERPRHEPQVLAVRPEHYGAVGHALTYIGQRLYAQEEGEAG